MHFHTLEFNYIARKKIKVTCNVMNVLCDGSLEIV